MARSASVLSWLAAAALLLNGASAALDPIVIKGSKFFFKTNGTQFFIKGVAYQSGIGANGAGGNNTVYVDPLANSTTCSRDIPLLQQLGVNTIRTYAIDPTKDHSQCMSQLDTAGIYVISDLAEPNLSIDRNDAQWTTTLMDRYTAVVDAFSSYSNVIGFFAGNEVPNAANVTGSTAMVKAAVRDTKAYIKAKGYRTMGVGYAADDGADVRADVASYLVCEDATSQIDFWGYNIYEWCGDSNIQQSGYADRVKEFQDYTVPSFFAEYGCNTQAGGAATRKFTEVIALYGDQMTPVFSGGIVYEWFEEANDYGLASVVNPSSVSTLDDYNAFSTQLAAASPSATNMASYNPTNTAAPACPTIYANWSAAASPLPPTPNKDACACMMASLSCHAKSSIDPLALGPLFGQVCGYNNGKACTGIARDFSTGQYGPFSMCNATEQLSNAFNAYYNSISGTDKAQACNFGGNATVVTPANAASSCSSVLSSASAAVTGGSPSASSTKKKNDAAGIVGPSLGMGIYAMVGFTLFATLSGMGMILL